MGRTRDRVFGNAVTGCKIARDEIGAAIRCWSRADHARVRVVLGERRCERGNIDIERGDLVLAVVYQEPVVAFQHHGWRGTHRGDNPLGTTGGLQVHGWEVHGVAVVVAPDRKAAATGLERDVVEIPVHLRHEYERACQRRMAAQWHLHGWREPA